MEELIKKLSTFKWHYIHKRRRTPLYTGLLLGGVAMCNVPTAHFDTRLRNFICIDTEIGAREEDWEALRVKVNDELEKDPELLLKLLKESYELNASNERFARDLYTKDSTNWDRGELLATWRAYISSMYTFASYAGLPIFIEADMERLLKRAVDERVPEQERALAYQVLTTPMKPGAAQEEERSLLTLAVAKEEGAPIDALVERHLENFAWTKNNSFENKFSTSEEIFSALKPILEESAKKKLAEYEKKISHQRSEFEKYRTLLSGDPRTAILIDTLQESIYFRSWRTERFYRNAYFLQPFFQGVASTLGFVNGVDLFYMTAEEITACLEGAAVPPISLIVERKEGYAFFSDGERGYIFSGDLLKRAKETVILNPVEMEAVIKGQVAYPGKVQGRVTVVPHKADLYKVSDGDILITTSTTVDYVPVLKKVRAIVTEEGGVLSHASVISRELHIPCVIGTKIATSVLKDGDMVEVDAERGVVRKI